ncbi:MAG: type II toxin-antitoxin system RelE/ParE family toxin [Candidatus Magasanikbacteria bacterium]|nr:type II toxin-antitoxin system RelE/ParE family toxin [Candidatus Magasanikbacteria bacterium]MBT4071856.1 type II toxin-antitoxin system RelE/ParE family toxin [Candidatus Magasanikbacteria bacterium]
MNIVFLDDNIEKFISNLRKDVLAKVLRNLDLLEQFGYKLGLPHSKKIKDKLFELRILGKIEVRIFYMFNKSKIILLHGFIKKSQKIPKKELRYALNKMNELDKV